MTVPSSGMDSLLARAQCAETGQSALMTAPEAERMIENLRQHTVDQVGSSAWLEQQSWIEKLNLQGHFNAQMHADEFVKDFLVSYDKINVLIHEILVMEVWKEKLLPELKAHMARKLDSVTTYLLIFHEVNLANLLEVVLFHEQAVENIEEDHLVELVDWCHRKLQYLNTDAASDAAYVERTTQELVNQTPEQELEEKLREVGLGVAVCAVTIVRYLTDCVQQLPSSVASRLLRTNDSVMALVPLADSPPWQRRRKGVCERFEGGRWEAVSAGDRFKLGSVDAQVWLALNNLLVDPHCRAKYVMDDFRKDSVLRLKRFMNDILLDQLPVLKDLQRVLDELALNYQPDLEAYGKGALIIEQVPKIRERLLQHDDWRGLAKRLKASVLAPGATSAAMQARMKSMLEAFEFMAASMPEKSAGDAQPVAAQQAPVKVALYRKSGGVMQAWTDLEFAINTDHEPTPVKLQSEDGTVVTGTQWRLRPHDLAQARPLPANGRVVVCHGDKTAEALLELPAPSTKSTADSLPAGLWVTIGLLAQDGFAAQLRLKRHSSPSERDRAEGVWFVYHAVGGAITLLDTISKPKKAAPVEQPKVSASLHDLD